MFTDYSLSDPYGTPELRIRRPDSDTAEIISTEGDDPYQTEMNHFIDAVSHANVYTGRVPGLTADRGWTRTHHPFRLRRCHADIRAHVGYQERFRGQLEEAP